MKPLPGPPTPSLGSLVSFLIVHIWPALVTMPPKKRSPPRPTHPHHNPDPATTASRPLFDHVHSFTLDDPRHQQHNHQRQPREGASSFFHPSLQAPPVDPSLQPQQPPVLGSPVPSSEGTAPESSSRRQSTSSTMRTSSLPLEGAPSSTPTGRISKAKKGKRVHACAYEGCGKVRLPAVAVSSPRPSY